MNDIIQSRVDFDKMGRNYPMAANVKIDKKIIDNIDCYWFKNLEKTNSNKIAIYLHGGCFVLGSINSHQGLVSHLAKNLPIPFIFPEYGLAPEKSFPNAINDLVKVYSYLQLSNYPKKVEIILIGDSAGAGLAVSLLTKLYETGLQPPTCMIMISPWIDLLCTGKINIIECSYRPRFKKRAIVGTGIFICR